LLTWLAKSFFLLLQPPMRKSIKKIKNNKSTVFFICLILSSLLWLMLKLSKEYELEIEIPIVYQELPADKALISPYDSLLTVQLSDNGFYFYGRQFLGIKNEIFIPLSMMRKNTSGDNLDHYYITTTLLSDQINAAFGSEKNFRIISPDTIHLFFSSLNSKYVPVKAHVNAVLAPQYQLKSAMKLNPDQVTIYGDAKVLSLTDTIFTESLSLENISQNYATEISLKLLHQLQASPSKVLLNIEVEKYTEAEIQVPLTPDILSDKKINIFPKNVRIRYAVSFEKYKEVRMEDFIALASADANSPEKLIIRLKKYPEFIRIIDFSPKVAEYIIIN